MEKGIKLGVKLINDVSGLNFDKNSIKILKKYNIQLLYEKNKSYNSIYIFISFSS